MAEEREWLTTREAAEKLGVSLRWMRRQIENKTIPFNKLGNVIRFRVEVLDELLAENDVEAEQPLRQHPGRAGYPPAKKRKRAA